MALSRLDIDLSAVDRNLAALRAVLAPPAAPDAPPQRQTHPVSICAVLKQDAYSCGSSRLAKRLAGSPAAPGVDAIAVYAPDEARAVADAAPNIPVLVLMPVFSLERTDPLYRHAASGRIHLTVHNPDQLAALTDTAARLGAPLPVHVQVDTGLSRGGSLPDTARSLVETVVKSQKIRLAGLMTHFASPCCDDAFTREQARAFRDFVQDVAPALKAALQQGARGAKGVDQLALHAANSCATFRARAYHGTMVRVGQSLLGYGSEEVAHPDHFEFRSAFERLEPAVRWAAPILHIQDIPPGSPVGYGSTWRAPLRADGRKSRIALIPVGYADGYPRSLGGKGTPGPGFVGLTGRPFERRGSGEPDDAPRDAAHPTLPTVYAPVVGRVSMDQITVDVTDVPDAYLRFTRSGNDTLGPEAELLGRVKDAPNYLPRLAHAAGTITHELLARLSPRIERAYRAPAAADPPTLRLPPRTTGLPGAAAVAQ